MKLQEAEELQNVFKSKINKKYIGSYKSEEQKKALEIFDCFANHEMFLSNYLMIILQYFFTIQLIHTKTILIQNIY